MERYCLVSEVNECRRCERHKSFHSIVRGEIDFWLLFQLKTGSHSRLFYRKSDYLRLFYYLHFVNKISLWTDFISWKFNLKTKSSEVHYLQRCFECDSVLMSFSGRWQKPTYNGPIMSKGRIVIFSLQCSAELLKSNLLVDRSLIEFLLILRSNKFITTHYLLGV